MTPFMAQEYCMGVQYGSPEWGCPVLPYFARFFAGFFGFALATCGSGGVFSIRRSTSSGEGAGNCWRSLLIAQERTP